MKRDLAVKRGLGLEHGQKHFGKTTERVRTAVWPASVQVGGQRVSMEAGSIGARHRPRYRPLSCRTAFRTPFLVKCQVLSREVLLRHDGNGLEITHYTAFQSLIREVLLRLRQGYDGKYTPLALLFQSLIREVLLRQYEQARELIKREFQSLTRELLLRLLGLRPVVIGNTEFQSLIREVLLTQGDGTPGISNNLRVISFQSLIREVLLRQSTNGDSIGITHVSIPYRGSAAETT